MSSLSDPSKAGAQRLLVTGGAGFLGSALIRRLLRETRHTLCNIDALTYAVQPGALTAAEGHPRYRFVPADIRDGLAMRRVVADFAPDAIIHLAAESHVDRSIAGPEVFIDTNVIGTHRLLEAVRAYWQGLDLAQQAAFRFLHVSTDEVYGSQVSPEAADEDSPFAPSSPYAASKAAADHLVGAWHQTYGLPTLITHGANSYGPYQHYEKLIPRMITAALTGIELPIYGHGQQIRDWLHVDDHAAAICRVLAAGQVGTRYNIAANAPRTNLSIVRSLCAAVDTLAPRAAPSAHRIRHIADRPGHDSRYAMDTRRLRETLGWQPQIELDIGLHDLVQWHLAHEYKPSPTAAD